MGWMVRNRARTKYNIVGWILGSGSEAGNHRMGQTYTCMQLGRYVYEKKKNLLSVMVSSKPISLVYE